MLTSTRNWIQRYAYYLGKGGHNEEAVRKHWDNFEKTRLLSDLENAIERKEACLKIAYRNHPLRPEILGHLVVLYVERYRQTGKTEYHENAIWLAKEALDLTPDQCTDPDIDRARRFEDLSALYRDQYYRTGVLKDLEDGIQNLQVSLELTPVSHPERARRLRTQGENFMYRYQDYKAIEDVDIAMRLFNDALKLIPDDRTNQGSLLTNLGLARVKASYHAALKYRAERASVLMGLGHIYLRRYGHLGALRDIDSAIRKFRAALDLTHDEGDDRANRFQDLASAYRQRYKRNKGLEDLDAANSLYGKALANTPKNHYIRARRLQGVADGLMNRYLRTGDSEDLYLIIQRYQEALDVSLEYGSVEEEVLDSLGDAYYELYKQTNALECLGSALTHCSKAVNCTLEDSPMRAGRLYALACMYLEWAQRNDEKAYFHRGVRCAYRALMHEASHPSDRFLAGKYCLNNLSVVRNWVESYKCVREMMKLLPLLTVRSLQYSDRQHGVRQLDGVASDMAAITLMAGQPVANAIESLEIGRGMIASSISDLRTDITTLDEKHPSLAARFMDLRSLLDTPTRSEEDTQRHVVGKEFESLMQEIRSLPGFERFLLAPDSGELKAAATYGPIVIVNISKFGSHALIIEVRGLRALKLPLVQLDEVEHRVKSLPNPDIEMLEWLWDSIANPVLTALGFIAPPEHTWSRIWWIPTGLLTRFPLHAAGYHFGSLASDTVIDRVISSYSSSLKSLVHSRQELSLPKPQGKQEDSMVLISMEQTPGYGSLRFAPKEIETLTQFGTSMGLQLKHPPPYRKEALAAVNGCKIFHFAGHGFTDSTDPGRSGLVLNDGKLTVESILEVNLHIQKPFLAYLSACGTGQVKYEKLVNEGLHLIAACQLTGFRHVIGTLWEVNDETCVHIAKKTYEWIQKNDLSDQSVSEGLHHASRELRSRWIKDNEMRQTFRCGIQSNEKAYTTLSQEKPYTQDQATHFRDLEAIDDLPLHWVPYVHFGI